jgi:cellulose synthase/poly-beta-1,6-N-acetylglucosamine synthase-like glycosyltransferase
MSVWPKTLPVTPSLSTAEGALVSVSIHAEPHCLESLLDFADEVVVADRGSTDSTLPIVREVIDRHVGLADKSNYKIVTLPSADAVQFENWALRHAQHSWIFIVLPDERLGADLAKETQDVLAANPSVAGFKLMRRRYRQGHSLDTSRQHSGARLRLFRRDAALFEMRGGQLVATLHFGAVGHLCSHLYLDTHPNFARPADQTVQRFAA